MLAGSQKALPTLVVLLACKFTKGEQHLTQNLPKGFALALPARGGREEKHLFPRLLATAWSNLAVVSDAFLFLVPGTANLS